MPSGNVPILQRIANQYTGYAYEAITVGAAAVGLTAAKYSPGNDKKAQVAHITIESNPINYTYDGTTPTALIGHNLVATSTLEIIGYQNIVNARFIRSGGADATIKVTYES